METPAMKQNEAIPTPVLPGGGHTSPCLLSLLALGRPPIPLHPGFPS